MQEELLHQGVGHGFGRWVRYGVQGDILVTTDAFTKYVFIALGIGGVVTGNIQRQEGVGLASAESLGGWAAGLS